MKILHITDSHGTVKSPESRNDLYYLTFLRKLKELEYIIKGNDIDMVIHTGDLFHTSRVSNKFMGQTAEIIKGWDVPVYVVPGNHDIDGYTIETIDQTSLGLLAKTGVIKLLDRMHPKKFVIGEHSVCISGQEYYADIDSGNPDDYDMQQIDGDINILAIHGYVADTPQNPHIRCTYIKDIITNADIVLSGHYHRSFAVESGGVGFYNPGSMMRVEMTDWNKTHMPQYGILDIEFTENDGVLYDYKLHNFRIAKPGNVVFDYTSKGIVKTHGVTLENFKNSIANTMQSLNVNSLTTDPRKLITNVIADYVQNNTDIDDPYAHSTLLEQLADASYNAATQKITDEDVIATKGFIPAQDYVKIAKVELHNFQSHEDTVVDLVDGFNIFVGESSNGKTSIVRAINWVINNKPLGTDFIMTGKKDCWVKITFSDGSYIERGRTLTDTGYYKVWDGNPQNVEQEYRGFTNAVPVEVMNVHQMPRISITKNLETHLNMMTQLERPFLITESVNDKAVAIGHITGTSVVDECIRSTVASNMSDTKMLKELAKQKAELEQQQQGYDITTLQSTKQTIVKLQQDLTSYVSNFDKVQEVKRQYETQIQEKQQIEQSVKDAEALLTVKPLIEQYQSAMADLQALLSIKRKYDSVVQELQAEQAKLQSANEVVKYKGICEQTSSLINKGLCCYNIMLKKKAIEGAVQSYEMEIEQFNKVITLKPLIDKINEGLVLVNNAVNIRNTYAAVYIQHTSESSKLSTIQLGIEADNGTMQDIIRERNEYVLSIGVCPCCGQKITKKNVNSIIENMEAK